jgi:predicted N-formylglutamate amidohydrolase
MTDIPSKLLTDQDPPPFEILNQDSEEPIVLLCEHAGQAVPKTLNGLGLSQDHYDFHYAYDPGIKALGETLARRLNAFCILGNYSRLVVDLNRPENERAFPTMGEGYEITGNKNLSAEEMAQRFSEIYDPYHDAVATHIDAVIAQGRLPLIVSLHSFTPVFHGEQRPWEIAALWVQDKRPVLPFFSYYQEKGFCVGDNEPYDARMVRGFSSNRHGDERRLPNILIEWRNDVLAKHEDIEHHADLCADFLSQVIKDPEIMSLYDGPQRPYDPDAEEGYFKQVMRTCE